jgi:vacuolar-type H+-ATPase subunit I/STV1
VKISDITKDWKISTASIALAMFITVGYFFVVVGLLIGMFYISMSNSALAFVLSKYILLACFVTMFACVAIKVRQKLLVSLVTEGEKSKTLHIEEECPLCGDKRTTPMKKAGK